MKNDTKIAAALKMLALFVGYSGPTVFKISVGEIDYGVFVSYFLFIGGLSILFSFWTKNFFLTENKTSFKKQFKQFLNVKLLAPLFVVGLVISLAYILYTEALMHKTVTETVLFVRLGPLLGVFFAMFFLQEKLKSISLFLLATIFSIIGALVTEGNLSNKMFSIAIPSLLALLAGILIQLAAVIRVYVNRKNIKMAVIIGFSMIIGSAITATWSAVNGQYFQIPSIGQLLGILYLGFGTLAIPMNLELLAVKFSGNFSRIAFLEFFGPFFAMFWSELLLQEGTWNEGNIIIGLILISLGAVLGLSPIKSPQATKKAADRPQVMHILQ